MPGSKRPQSSTAKTIKTMSAGAVIVRSTPAGWQYLILRAYRNWDFPKGLLDQGEEPLAAAVREVREETAIEQLNFPWGAAYRETAIYAMGKIARYYLAETNKAEVTLPRNEELGRPEHHEFRWLPYAEARALLPARLLPIIDWAEHLIDAAGS